jgi:Fe-S-cluster-containing dehydrogenase component
MKRREFLKLTAAGGLLLAADAGVSRASEGAAAPPDAVGLLYDATLCIGCKSCMVACKKENAKPGGALFTEGAKEPPYEYDALHIHDDARDLTGRTVNVIQEYRGTGGAKDTPEGWSFVKKQCMHCVHPACVSACPVSAMRKDGRTGIVTYNKEACIGCRYCQVACPYNVPRFEWDQAFPQIRKCQLCNHRIAEGTYSACAEACPVGATIFGKVADLRAEAQRRVALPAGSDYDYPQQRVDSGRRLRSRVAKYQPHVYGLAEVGGSQCLVLAGVPFERIGFPALPEQAYAAASEGIQHTLYKGMIAPGVLLAGLVFAAYKNSGGGE